MFNTNVFSQEGNENRNKCSFEDSDVIFVADMFDDEHIGGAELSTEALFSTSPHKTFKVKSANVSEDLISKGTNKVWVFFNYRGMNHELIPFIVQNLNYFIVEYDYKFCQFRSIDLHFRQTGKNCDCHNMQLGKIVSSFYYAAKHIFWMSEAQRKIYEDRFPFLAETNNSILSSIFKDRNLELIENLRKTRVENKIKDKFVIVDGKSWIKCVLNITDWLLHLLVVIHAQD